MAAMSSSTLLKTARRMRCSVILANQRSIWLSHEALVGVEVQVVARVALEPSGHLGGLVRGRSCPRPGGPPGPPARWLRLAPGSRRTPGGGAGAGSGRWCGGWPLRWKAAGREEFDAVVGELGLLDGTGNELMAQLRERYGPRGIALSGYGMEDDMGALARSRRCRAPRQAGGLHSASPRA